jgi:hypothetical protein
MDYALLLVFTAAIAVGVAGSFARTWSFQRRLYSLEDRLSTVEGITTREVKIRAATSRPRANSAADEAIAMAMANPKPAVSTVPWYAQPNLKRGGYIEPSKGNS